MKQCIGLLLLVCLAGCHFRTDRKKLAAIMQLPSFKIVSIDSCKCVSTVFIPEGRSSIFVYFDPDCEHCQQETKTLLAHVGQLPRTNLYFVTNGDDEELRRFNKFYGVDTNKNVRIGRDFEYSFYRTYLPPGVPFMAIYNEKRQLIKIYNGETNINSIISAIHG